MLCYKDRWHCLSHRGCDDGPTCDRALTGDVIAAAEREGLPIQKVVMPECFRRNEDIEQEDE